MSESITWAVLTDGRYIRVLYNKGSGQTLQTLKADDCQPLADLCYEVVTGVKPGSTNGTASRKKSNMQLLADFLAEQLQAGQYQKLILVAPPSKLAELESELDTAVSDVIIDEVGKDLLALSIDAIEQELGNLMVA